MPQRANAEPPDNGTPHTLRDLVSRNDERINMLLDKNDELEAQIDQLEADNTELKDELVKTKALLETLTKRVDKIDGLWEKIFDMFWKIALMVIGGAILYYMGLQSPPG